MTEEQSLVRRMSPRPFALHMMIAAGAWASSKAGLPRWSAGSPSSNPAPSPLWPAIPESLAAALAKLDPGAFDSALNHAVLTAADRLAAGIEAYRRHPYRRADDLASTVWQAGQATLLDHGSEGGTPVLFVPSLINRGWVLDLVPGEGMLSWLASRGLHCFRLEWGSPDGAELRFSTADYVAARLEPALEEVTRRTGRRPLLVGYCMGGLLALQAALRRPELVSGLALLATPWDFHAEGRERAETIAALNAVWRPFLTALGVMPVDLLQALFAFLDPAVAVRKFQRFSSLDPGSSEARQFVAVEDWLNDGVPLSLPVTEEALAGWYGQNTTAHLQWRPAGLRMDPAALSCPTLVVVPGTDRLVPPASANAIRSLVPHADSLEPALGHIGMVVGRSGKEALWQPLADWIARVGDDAKPRGLRPSGRFRSRKK